MGLPVAWGCVRVGVGWVSACVHVMSKHDSEAGRSFPHGAE